MLHTSKMPFSHASSSKLNRELLAWAAGFFDGEGCTYLHTQNKQPRILIGQLDTEVLAHFDQATLRLGKLYGPYQPKGVYHYNTYGFEKCQAIIAMLWPWLGSIKRIQARKVLKGW